MSYTGDDLQELLRGIRYDATAIQAKVTDLLTALASMDLPAPKTSACPVEGCGLEIRPPTSLQDHLHTAHGQT